MLPYGAGELKVEKVIPCDVSYDSMADVDEKTLNDKRFSKHGDYSIQGLATTIGKDFGGVDIFVHSIAFSPEIKNKAIDTSRKAYLTALSISSFSLTAMLKALQPYMEGRPDGASALALSYLGGDRVVPHYGGGMSTAKAALQIDAKQLASNLGPKNIRVNIISAGPYASRAASAIGDIDQMIGHAAACSPLPRGITAEEVGTTAAFLCSPLASGITGHVLYVDCGYNVMGIFPKAE
jgi:enoyl-[acyl-carrier protein] reductase I